MVPLGHAICDTSPAFIAGHNTPRMFSSEQTNFKPSFKFQVAVDVVVVVVDATVVVVVVGVVVDATVVVVVVGVVVVFGLRSRKWKALWEFLLIKKSKNSQPVAHSKPHQLYKMEHFAEIVFVYFCLCKMNSCNNKFTDFSGGKHSWCHGSTNKIWFITFWENCG